ncbi:hypothetical protein AMTR_s00004p00268930 [Amborella trichopoda]|uniref:Uncharacterized protein n=1 Tax=Amborella trichopoda TaxID=13333 RepID=W1NED5_AMBTC|nr:hypothetical protein AMTR_s00004p00268930 [Amborella trichopoda]
MEMMRAAEVRKEEKRRSGSSGGARDGSCVVVAGWMGREKVGDSRKNRAQELQVREGAGRRRWLKESGRLVEGRKAMTWRGAHDCKLKGVGTMVHDSGLKGVGTMVEDKG